MRDLLITASSLGHPPLEVLAKAARAAGFNGLSIWPHRTYQEARSRGLSPAEMRAIVSDQGLRVNDVDAVLAWVGEDPGGKWGAREADLLEVGEALAARYVNVVLMSRERIPVEQGAEVFAGVCARAAERGLVAHLEFVPFLAVPDARTAWRIVEASGRPEAGLLLDTWHCFRGTTTLGDLRALPGERVLAVQINDAPAEPAPDPEEETLHHRLACGAGDLDLVGFVRVLDRIGSPAPLTVEVFSDALLERYDPFALAQLHARALRGVVAEAASAPGEGRP